MVHHYNYKLLLHQASMPFFYFCNNIVLVQIVFPLLFWYPCNNLFPTLKPAQNPGKGFLALRVWGASDASLAECKTIFVAFGVVAAVKVVLTSVKVQPSSSFRHGQHPHARVLRIFELKPALDAWLMGELTWKFIGESWKMVDFMNDLAYGTIVWSDQPLVFCCWLADVVADIVSNCNLSPSRRTLMYK